MENRVNRIRRAILGIAVSVWGSQSLAQDFVNVYEIPHNVSINVISNQLYHENINKTLHHWDRQAEKDRYKPAMRVPLAQATGTGISELSKGLPREQIDAGRAAYRQAFNYHEQVIKKFDLPSGDLGVALASCIAGAWMAYNNKPFPDEYFRPLVEQMRQLLGRQSSAMGSVSAAERGSAYERLAVVGMLLASSQITWQRKPRAPGADELRSRMRQQGGDTLARLLQLPPDHVGIGAAGVFALNDAKP